MADDIAVVESFSHSSSCAPTAGWSRSTPAAWPPGGAVVEAIRGWSTEPFSHVDLHPRPRRPRRRQRGVRRRRRRARRRAADLPRPRERPAPAGPLRAHQRLEPADQPPPVRLAARRPGHGHRRRERALPARRRRGARRHLPRRAHRRGGRHGDPPDPRAARPTTTRGRGCPSTGWHASATCSSGTSRTPATRRRCSATRRTGPPRCGRSSSAEPELLLPAHGLPIAGRERIARVLDVAATALESLVARRAGDDERWRLARRDHPHRARRRRRPAAAVHAAAVRRARVRRSATCGAATAAGGTPTRRTSSRRRARPWPPSCRRWPAASDRLAGARRRARRRRRPAPGLPPRRARRGRRSRTTPRVHAVRADIYERRRHTETSLMTKGIYAATVRESRNAQSG